MPPQSPSSPAQVPGEDVLLDTLKRSKITDEQRQQIWDAYHVQGDEKAWVDNINKLQDVHSGSHFPDDIKQTLYDMRFKGFKNEGTKATQQAPAPTAQQSKAMEPIPFGPNNPILKPGDPGFKEMDASWAKQTQPSSLGRYQGLSDIGKAVIEGGKAFGSDVAGIVQGLSKFISDPVPQGEEVGAQVAQLVSEDARRKQEGRSGFYRGAAAISPLAQMNTPAMEEAARQGNTAGVVGHMILPLLGLMGGREAVKERGITERPIAGGVGTGDISGLTRENVTQLRAKGFSNQEMANWNTSDIQAALSGSKKPTPVGRPTEAVPGAKASATNQSAAAPSTSQVSSVPTKGTEPTPSTHVGDVRGAKGPLRPYDPTGTRFAQGGTIGLDPLDASQLIAPPLKGPVAYTPSEKAATMSAPQKSLGPEFELDQRKHEIDRNNEIIDSPKSSPEDKRIARSRLEEGLITKPEPINRGTQAGVTPPDQYYKPAPPPLVPSSEVEPPSPKPVEPKTRSIVPRPHELPSEVQSGLDMMMSTKKLIDNAKTPEAKSAAQDLWDRTAALTKAKLKNHFDNLTPAQLVQLKGDQEAEGSRHEQQSQAIKDIVAGDKMAKAIREEMAPGQPVRAFPGTTTQFSKRSGAPIGMTGTTPGILRREFHKWLGDQTAMEFDQVALNQRAKARDEGLDPDSIQPEGYQRLSPEELQAQRLIGKTEAQELQDSLKARLKAGVEDRLEKNKSLVLQQGEEEAVKIVHAQVLRELLAEKDEDGRTVVERLKDIQKLLGRDPQRPIYKKKGEPIVTAEGVVKAPGDIPSKSLAVARRIWGKQLNKIPDDTAWQKKADEHLEKGRLAKAIAKGIDAFLKVRPPKGKEGEAGVIGEATPPTKVGSRSSVTAKDLDPIRLLAKAKEMGLEGHQVTDDEPAGAAGWLSPDGKVWIDKGSLDHDDIAMTLLHPHTNPMFGMLENGWVRKAKNGEYEAWNLNKRAVDTIEMDAIRNRMGGRMLLIDARGANGLRAMHIDAGWEDLGKAVSIAKREQGFTSETGASGIALTTGFGLGGVVGTVAGAIHGGVTGAMVGGTIGMAFGFMAPAVLTSLPVRNAMKVMANIVRGAGVSLKTWFQGPPQVDISGISPEMDRIMREQQLHNEPDTTWAERALLLPSKLYTAIDPAAYVADKKNMTMVGKIIMSLDPKGRVFRDLNVPDTASLYLAVSNAHSDALGLRADKGMQYRDIKSDANKAGVAPMLTAYLNLAAYKRTNEVVQEHIQDLMAQEQNIQTKLQSPSNSIRQNIALHDDLTDVRKMQKELTNRLQSGKVTPGGFNPKKIQDAMDAFQTAHPQEFALVEQLAQRAFKVRTPILDMLLDNGIISQDAYVTYRQRGDAYVPMRRIMDDLEPPKGKGGGVSVSPLHLKYQTVIQRLEGSERTNLDPWQAFDDDDKRAFNNIIRNGVIKKALDLAAAYPTTVGQEFTPVQPDYQPKAGEMIVSHYENGKPNLFAVPKYIGETLEKAPLATQAGFSVLAQWMEHAFKKGATVYNVAFLGRSTLSHALSSMMLSKYGASPLPTEVVKFINDWRKAAVQVYRDGPFYRELVKGGAAFGGFSSLFSPERFTSPDEVGVKAHLKKGQILEAMSDFAVAAENVNRVNILMRATKQGVSMKQALFEAKQFGGAPNFDRLGTLSKSLNHAFMFVNARAQYPVQVMSAIRKNPARVFTWIAMLTAMNIANTTANLMYKDANGVSTYRKISTYDRERNWVVMTPWTYGAKTGARLPIAFKIPKPFLAQMVVNPLDEAITYLAGKDARTGTQQALDAVSSISPIHINLKEGQLLKSAATSLVSAAHPLFKTAVQQFANVDDFGRPIVPPSEQGIATEFQEGPYTSSVAQRMGQGGIKGALAGGALGGTVGSIFGPAGAVIGGGIGAGVGATGQSPRRIDTATRSLSASIGTQAETMLDPFFGGLSKRHELQGTEKAIATPVVGGAARGFLTSPQDAEFQALSEQFYSTMQQASVIQKTIDHLLQQGKPDEAAKYAQDNQNELFKSSLLSRLFEPIQTLNQQIRQLQADPSSNTPAGRQSLEIAYEARTELLRGMKNLIESIPSKSADTTPMGGSITSTVK